MNIGAKKKSPTLDLGQKVFLLASITIVLIFNPAGFDSFNLPKLLTLLVTALILFFLGLLAFIGNLKERERFLFGKLELGLSACFVLMILLMGISSMINHENLYRTLLGYPGRYNGILFYLSISIMGLWIVFLMNRITAQKIMSSIITISGTVVLFYGIFQALGADFVDWDNPYNPIVTTFGNPNFSASYLAAVSVWFFAISFHLTTKRRYTSLLMSFSSALISALTGSIQGPALTVIGLLLVVFTELLAKRLSTVIKRLSIILFSIIASVLTVSAMGYGPFGENLYQPTLRLRYLYWKTAWDSISNNWLFGTGPDTYWKSFRIYRDPEIAQTWGASTVADSAHNVFLNFGNNFGLLAMLLLLSLIFVSCYSALRKMNGNEQASAQERALAAVYIILVIQSCISIEQIGLSLPMWLLLAFHLVKHEKLGIGNSLSKSSKSKLDLELVISQFTIIVVAIPALYLANVAWKENTKYFEFLGLQKNTSIGKEYVKDFAADLRLNSTKDPRLAVKIAQFYLTSDYETEGLKLLDELIERNPSAIEPLELRAIYLQEKERFSEALSYRRQLELRDPYNVTNLLEMGKILIELENSSLAVVILKKISQISPTSPESPISLQLINKVQQ